MSLVNSMINQVGREIGRDLYWSAKQSFFTGSQKIQGRANRTTQVNSSGTNGALLSMVSKKKWSSRMRFTAMAQDIKETIEVIDEKVNPRSFDWREIYTEVDNKIDDLKLTCKEEEAAELELLDRQNFVSYSVTLSRHKTWLTKELENSVATNDIPSKTKIFVLSPFGLTSSSLRRGDANAVAEILCAIIWWALIGFGVFKYCGDTSDKAGLGMIGIGLVFYLLILAGDFISLSELRKSKDQAEGQRNKIREYIDSLDTSL